MSQKCNLISSHLMEFSCQNSIYLCFTINGFQTVFFKAGQKLHFLFHSDGSNNEWGYKFKVEILILIS